MNPYFQEVLDAHIAIEQWLGAGQGDLAALLGRFRHDYSMITLAGGKLDHPALTAFFSAQRGSRPGLVITIDEMTLIQESSDGATVLYREHQRTADGAENRRWSTAVLALENGVPRWLHLHETRLE